MLPSIIHLTHSYPCNVGVANGKKEALFGKGYSLLDINAGTRKWVE